MKDYQAKSKAKWQRYLSPQQQEKAFTLIELIVVIIILGILAAIAFPNLINQIGKARETEAKNQLGSLLRAQQAFHLEKKVFADSLDKLSLTGSFNPKYYNYPEPTTVNIVSQVKQKANALSPLQDRVRHYATGIYFENEGFTIIFCQSDDVNVTVDAPNTPSDDCTGGTKLE